MALEVAADRGLQLPLVYNTCGWERKKILALLDGVADIYLADMKYMDPETASALSSGAGDYPEITQAALLEMNRQVGVAKPGPDGLIRRGLMIRHLVMPGEASGSVRAMQWIAANLPPDTYVNIMIQYRPAYRAHSYPEIDRAVSYHEYTDVVNEARMLGLTNLDVDI
jgi:putative pyruvate formate lyase activating enzyme